ncbi:hypothetical protein [Chitinophaga sp. OAE865]|uniref:hypothetical protein n=1 Tax=Chitinophaga sp. OAE865 TaxID=2817898 RepID=UPI001AE2824F
MKKNILFFSFLTLFACKKTESPEISPIPDIESEIMGKRTYQEFEMMPVEKKFSIVNFLDTASTERIERVQAKIADLQAGSTPGRKQVNNKSLALLGEPTPQEYVDVLPMNATRPGVDYVESNAYPDDSYYYTGNIIDFIYKWQAFENILGLYKIYSNEKFQIQKESTDYYKIVTLQHQSSYIVGITGGVEWTETLSNNYTNNLYFAYLYIAGTISGYGITVERSNTRYVNARVAFFTSGGHY